MASATLAPPPAPPVPMGLRVQLSVLMFLQFAVWGAWFSVFANRLSAMNLGAYIGNMYGTLPLGAIFAPLIVGQLADRLFSSQRLLAVLHLAGAGMLYWMATIPPVTDPADKVAIAATYSQFWWITFGYALLFNPTLALANSIAFTHLPDGQRDFPGVRVLGTIGWIAAGLTVGLGLPRIIGVEGFDAKTSNVPLLLASGLSAVLAVYSLTLPHTPPKGESTDLFPALKAIGLLKNPSFAVFFGASFLITIVLAFYYNYTGVYLAGKHAVEDVASWMTIGQVSEMLILPFLPFFLQRFGMKWVLAIGMLAWGVRYAIFALCGIPPASVPLFVLVLVGVALHGVCFDFFFAAGFIHVDKEAPADIRGSGQALFTFLTYGLGLWVGSLLSNYVAGITTREVPAESVTKSAKVFNWVAGQGLTSVDVATASAGTTTETDWFTFWIVPAGGVLVALAVFVIGFRDRKKA